MIFLFMTILSFITAFLCSPHALQKIYLANSIHSLAELLHADMIQQLEVVLFGTPAAKILNVLMMATKFQPVCTPLSFKLLHSATTPLATTSSMIVVPPLVPIVGVTQVEKSPSTETAASKVILLTSTSSDPKVIPSKCWRILPTPIPATSSSVLNLLSIVVPELAILVYTLPEWINFPGGCKDYKCQICAFQHTNKDCMWTHILQHLEISVSCPMCGKGFQNVASLHKHGRKVHSIQIGETEKE